MMQPLLCVLSGCVFCSAPVSVFNLAELMQFICMVYTARKNDFAIPHLREPGARQSNPWTKINFRKFNFYFWSKTAKKGPNYGNASNTFSYSTYFDDFPKLFLETTKFNTPINCLFTSASFTILGGSDTDAEESKNPSLSSTKSYNRS